MKRTKTNNNNNNPLHKGDVSAILTADMHIVESNPICRQDDLVNQTQWKKLQWLSDLQRTHNCKILHAGDLLDYWKSSPWLISRIAKYLPKQLHTVYGNHDLPQHNAALAEKSGVHALNATGVLEILRGFHWGSEPELSCSLEGRKVSVGHIMTYQGEEPYPGCTSPRAAKLLRKYPTFDLIVTGDNHKPFVEKYEGRLLVNPGSLFRLKADQQKHRPRVYLWYAESNTVEAVYVPIAERVISREHIEHAKQRNDRIEAFVENLNDDWEAEMSFEENLKRFLQKNNTPTEVRNIIYKSIEN